MDLVKLIDLYLSSNCKDAKAQLELINEVFQESALDFFALYQKKLSQGDMLNIRASTIRGDS
jgi:hypothetical protein